MSIGKVLPNLVEGLMSGPAALPAALKSRVELRKTYTGNPIRGRAVKPGDIVLKYNDGSPENAAIELAQGMQPKNYPTFLVHAGIISHGPKVASFRYVVEMAGNGLLCNDLNGHNRKYDYEVFRAKNQLIAKEVQVLARKLAKCGKQGEAAAYNYAGLAKAFVDFDRMVTLDEFNVGFENMINNRNVEQYYCSQLVVWLFEGAKLRVGANDDLWGSGSVHRSPASMGHILKVRKKDAWQHVGHLAANKR